MAFAPVDALYRRGKYILQHEGWLSFLKQGFSFVRNLFFSYGNYYIYEKELNPIDEVIKFKPKIDCTFRMVSSSDELDKLIAQGYNFKAMNFKPKLEKGALAFCLFVGQEVAHVTWVAPNKEAKKEIDYLPFKVNIEIGEVCSGASLTDPTYRGKGLFSHTYSYIFSYLTRNGTIRDKFTIELGNVASQKALAKFNPIIISSGHHLKILWWHSWKEIPIEETKV